MRPGSVRTATSTRARISRHQRVPSGRSVASVAPEIAAYTASRRMCSGGATSSPTRDSHRARADIISTPLGEATEQL